MKFNSGNISRDRRYAEQPESTPPKKNHPLLLLRILQTLLFIQSLLDSEIEAINQIKQDILFDRYTLYTFNGGTDIVLTKHEIPHVYEPVESFAWNDLNERLYAELFTGFTDEMALLQEISDDIWSHYLISELNVLQVIGSALIYAQHLFDCSNLILKHDLDIEQFETLKDALLNSSVFSQVDNWILLQGSTDV